MTKKKNISKSELADQYGVSPDQLDRWLKMWEEDLISKFRYVRNQKILTPAQLDFIYEKIGRP